MKPAAGTKNGDTGLKTYEGRLSITDTSQYDGNTDQQHTNYSL